METIMTKNELQFMRLLRKMPGDIHAPAFRISPTSEKMEMVTRLHEQGVLRLEVIDSGMFEFTLSNVGEKTLIRFGGIYEL